MLGSKEYTGIILEGGALKIAQLKGEGGRLRLTKLDRYSLVEELVGEVKSQSVFDEGEGMGSDQDADAIFGFDEEDEEDAAQALSDSLESSEEEINFDDLEEEGEEDLLSMDMVEEADTAQSNEVLFYNILSSLDTKKVNFGINITAGTTIFQIIRDTDFNEVKKKDLIADLEEKLESIYGVPKSQDNYAYEIKENGSLLLASIDDEPSLLQLVDRSRDFYAGKLVIDEIMSDEIILTGLTRANYDLQPSEITGIIQFSPNKCRIIFLRGEEIWQVSPLINEGTNNKNFLNTVFSKILFQLDTGEVPNLDRIIIANNTLGQEAVEFFKKNFADIEVGEFKYDEEKFDFGDIDPASANAFTTAIGMAWATSPMAKEDFPQLSFLPSYVIDRQKIFKLQWHGVILLLLIFLAPITFNHFYQQYSRQIDNLSSELDQVNAQITEVTPTFNSTNRLTEELGLVREKLVLLDTLSKGSREWSAKMDLLNEGLRNIGSTWFTSLSQGQPQGNIRPVYLEGYTLYRARIPRVVDLFAEATLMNVDIEENREQEVYRFSIMISRFVRDRSVYSPDTPEEIEEILN